MEGLKESLHEIIAEVLKSYDLSQLNETEKKVEKTAAVEENPITGSGIFSSMEDAVQAAVKAQRELILMPLSKRKEIIQAIRDTIIFNREIISSNATEETGFGRKEDKIIKHILAASKTPGVEDIEPEAFSDEHGLTLVEKAPYGVIGAIIPSTNPTSTVTSNGIGMISAGNSVVFNPHPYARKVSCQTISLINEAIVAVGGPSNLMTCISKPNIESANELMHHKNIAILVVTGGPGVVKAAMNSGKKVIAAGPGNPPCVVDETADLVKAGKDIVNGASFDNNIICICEKEVIVVDSVADKLIDEMVKNGAYLLNNEQTKEITQLVVSQAGCPGKEGVSNKDYVGKNAKYIAKAIGLDVPDSTKILLCEVETDHPLIWTEQLMPVLPLTRVNNVDTAIELAVNCEHGFRHTAMMHSKNIEKLSKMAKIMNCSLFVKNGPSYAGLAQGGAGFTSFTIASPTGEGLTRARTFTRERRCTLVDYFRIV